MKLILLLSTAASLVVADNELCPAGQGYGWDPDTWERLEGCHPCESGEYRPADHYSNYCKYCPEGYTNGVTGATDDSGCTKCAEGYMRDADSDECVACPQGTYSDTFDATSCTSCPEGTTTRYSRSWSASECIDVSCSPGYGYDWGDEECRICDGGKYSDDGQTPECKLCPIGSRTTEDGATSVEQCSECWGGYERQGDKCVECPAGTWRSGNEDRCQPCPEGTNKDRSGRFVCSCLPGYERDFGAHPSVPCTICPRGTYSYFGGFCQRCQGRGETTEGEGTTLYEDCICKKGYTRDDSGRCVKCPMGTFSDTIGDASCTSCPEGTTTTIEGADDASSCFDASCAPGEGYMNGGCEKCVGPTYSTDGKTPGCVSCPRGSKPKAAGATSMDQCTECWGGWGKEGDSCVECPIGTFHGYWTSEKACQLCPEGSTNDKVGSVTCTCERGNWNIVSDYCQECPTGTYFFHGYCLPSR